MRSSYCKKGDSMVSRDMSDGSKIGMCKKGWSVFFATMRKKGWKETESHGGKVTQETFALALKETKDEITTWFEEKNVPIGGVIGTKKNEMELRSGTPATDGRVFALTNDSKTNNAKQEVIEWFESKYKKTEDDDCGCGNK